MNPPVKGVNLSWSDHFNTIVAKASKRLYFLKQLKAAGVPQQLLHFYIAVIRAVLKYVSAVWHYAITRVQSQQLESIQKRAIHNFQFHPSDTEITNFTII